MTSRKLESELKCALCRRWLSQPLLLPCGHSLCQACCSGVLQPADEVPHHHPSAAADSDQMSVASETDSGVSLPTSSRPGSSCYYIGGSRGSLQSPTSPASTATSAAATSSGATGAAASTAASAGAAFGFLCPVCRRPVFLPDRSLRHLPRNLALERLVGKFCTATTCGGGGGAGPESATPRCQLCDASESPQPLAELVCEQCEMYYCERCAARAHPARQGAPKHNLQPAAAGRDLLLQKLARRGSVCPEHRQEAVSAFCHSCRTALCAFCAQDARHEGHEIGQLNVTCKSAKVTYRMEPAGSHGVWCLDDFQFVPFIWGSGQLVGSRKVQPSDIPQRSKADALASENLFFGCVSYIFQVKSGPFEEHSSTIHGISGVPTWDKVNSGLMKMYKAEILAKYPIIQHFYFGELLPMKAATEFQRPV